MEKFSKTLRGYNADEVNTFIDEVISRVEEMVKLNKKNEEEIDKLKNIIDNKNKDITKLYEEVSSYEKREDSINKVILTAQDTSDQMRQSARAEREIIIDAAKKNADRIINNALQKSEQLEFQASMLKKNISIYKRRLRGIIETQLDIVDEIDQADL